MTQKMCTSGLTLVPVLLGPLSPFSLPQTPSSHSALPVPAPPREPQSVAREELVAPI